MKGPCWAVIVGIASASPAGCLLELDPSYGATEGTGAGDGSGATDLDDSEGSGGVPPIDPPPPPGYERRECGFDLDHDGVRSELDVDCTVCNGDPNDNPELMQEIYVDCDLATASENCGSPDSPCNALNGLPKQNIDQFGPVVICFRGTCRPDQAVELDTGHSESHAQPASGSQVRAFEYPKRPMMVVGWDANGDGVYPPVDSAETAVIDATNIGAEGGHAAAFVLRTGGSDHDIELAHFEVRGLPGLDGGGLIHRNAGNANDDYTRRVYLHDLRVTDTGLGLHGGEDRPLLFLFTAQQSAGFPAARWRHLAFENSELINLNGPIIGHASDDPEGLGPLRLANLTVQQRGCESDCPGLGRAVVFSHAGGGSQIEIIDNVFDRGNDWQPISTVLPSADLAENQAAIRLGPCMHDVLIRNNRISGYATGVQTVGREPRGEGFLACDGPVDDVRIIGNVFADIDDAFDLESLPIHMVSDAGMPDPQGSGIGTVHVLQNQFLATEGWYGCATADFSGDPGTPSLVFAHNTCSGTVGDKRDDEATPALLRVVGTAAATGSVHNNIFAVPGTAQLAASVRGFEAGWSADGNVYPPDATFSWALRAGMTFSDYQAESAEPASLPCEPEFADATDLHLDAADACAQQVATSLVSPSTEADDPMAVLIRDIDGQPRPTEGPVDAGADEVF